MQKVEDGVTITVAVPPTVNEREPIIRQSGLPRTLFE